MICMSLSAYSVVCAARLKAVIVQQARADAYIHIELGWMVGQLADAYE